MINRKGKHTKYFLKVWEEILLCAFTLATRWKGWKSLLLNHTKSSLQCTKKTLFTSFFWGEVGAEAWMRIHAPLSVFSINLGSFFFTCISKNIKVQTLFHAARIFCNLLCACWTSFLLTTHLQLNLYPAIPCKLDSWYALSNKDQTPRGFRLSSVTLCPK